MSPNRRSVLLGGGALALGGGIWAFLEWSGSGDRELARLPSGELVSPGELITEIEPIRELGRAVLAREPGWTREFLERSLFQGSRWEERRSGTRARLLEQIREDYEEGRTQDVHGWTLSATEAGLCALVELASRR